MNVENRLPDPILITGAARSGASLVAGAINLCGAFGGKMQRASLQNPKGMFENARVANEIVTPYLLNLGLDASGQHPLPDVAKLSIPVDWRQRVERIMLDEGYNRGLWMYKDARICLLWPVWKFAFPDAKVVIVRRRTGDIVNSCMKTNFMQAFYNSRVQRLVKASDEREGWLWWVGEHEKRFVEIIESGINVKIVWPERMVHGDYKQIMETIDWLGLKWRSEVLTFIDPRLWKARQRQE